MNYMSLGMSLPNPTRCFLLFAENNGVVFFSSSKMQKTLEICVKIVVNLCGILKCDSNIPIKTLPKTETIINHFQRFKTDSYQGWVKTLSHA